MPSYLDKLKERFGAEAITLSAFTHKGAVINQRVIVPVEQFLDVMKLLKLECGFDMLADVTCVDYLQYPDARDRYGVIYPLTNTSTGERVVVKTFVNDPDPAVPSVYDLWKGADWLEREVYDMYGIRFDGHPDLRRILMPDEFASYPLRKDYPLRGKAERHNFPILTRADG
ncbi:NADH-quinone oxidoreductase subunit C [Tuwongella immobilis]|uniref:NADH-quinone oxidoreductase subunit C n=1 Tax=Tuwongella immobilis TaxID=692036 RepID=A0A6C2YIU1_9BACT|nr:NADH-quinone oxidoreductase subunit C [Tuwongella immobilis]VIP00892.1 nadh dehydrogenase subunit c : NADH-quinone oxidoreductase subunit C OS=Planctomyces limnophilus (strain ATCC 43296 / DSM 3776 / IFAM 1008 / 290) GN=nuoC PE=3 SV=1: Complex1_30kDa [Tuwongella immobilis]VTR97202.1 nadh dehydrogenase subunit c : NADH-quinone oxidoreductase subunit C OS=Planctomyces limnophilus (strain ATCC 43296 / DSM 3776 / IFAM 1008 / 290) GN=nuoC PE=3 SV=1: Complex1_30kDa [Tuwongella immobilis]